MHCPKCQEPLKKRMIDTHEIDECAKCQGTWFDREALRKVKDQADPDLNWMDFDLWKHPERFQVEVIATKCPKCSTRTVIWRAALSARPDSYLSQAPLTHVPKSSRAAGADSNHRDS